MIDGPSPLRSAATTNGPTRGHPAQCDVTRLVEVPVRPECVVEARRAVRRLAGDAGLPRDRIDDLLVAVSEAVTNAMEAQLAAGVPDALALTCCYDDDRLVVELEDQGDGFDMGSIALRPAMAQPADLLLERGWGITLMHTLVDDVAFRSTPRGTAVRLVVARRGR